MAEKILSICIPTCNRQKELRKNLGYIKKCAAGLENQIEICVSDNCSSDDTFQMLTNEKKDFPVELKVSRNEKNLGYDFNVMKVLKMGSARYIWLLGDDDFVVNPGFVELFGYLEKNTDDGCFLFRVDGYLKQEWDRKPQMLKVQVKSVEDLIKNPYSNVSEWIFTRTYLDMLFSERKKEVEGGVGTESMHLWIIRLLCFYCQPKCWKTLSARPFTKTISLPRITNVFKQINFMFDSFRGRMRIAWLGFIDMNIPKRYLPVFIKDLLLQYLRVNYNFILARIYRDAGFDRHVVGLAWEKFGLLFPIFIGPYAILSICPKLFLLPVARGLSSISIKLRIISRADLEATQSRWVSLQKSETGA